MIMDYEKKLALAKEALDSGSYDKETIEYIFPELKESDERIRKAIIEFFELQDDNTTYSFIPKKDILAWLEKQGEQKSDDVEEPNFFDDFRKSDVEVDSNEDGLIAETIKYKKEKQGEQKPTWSEEDEEIYRKCICVMRASACGFPEEEKFVEQVDNWLKSLKERVQPQHKQEWSEEDNQYLYGLIGLIEQSKAELPITLKGKAADNCINWLKSLRPQNRYIYNPYKEVVESIAEMCKHYDKASHSGLRDFYDNVKVKCKEAKEYDSLYPQSQWKPSDEQIKALDIAIRCGIQLGSCEEEALKSLKEQLLKL